MKLSILSLSLWCLTAWVLPTPAATPAKPNIVLILADDLGHGHVSCFNPQSLIKTPRVDRLASEGIRLTDAHSGSAVCSPTRYGILTGRYAWRTRLKSGVLVPYDPPLIEKDRLTLPAMLRQQGYRAACIGKWHLGWEWPGGKAGPHDFTAPITEGPTTRGFDYYFGTDVPNYPPYAFIENDRLTTQPTAEKPAANLDGRVGPMAPGWQFDAILPELTRRSVNYIERCAKEKQPFFLFMTLTSPHEPIAPSAGFRGKSGLDSPLADFIIETDATVGAVVDAVQRAGIVENTLVIFTADNGSSLYSGAADLQKKGHAPSAGFRAAKGSIYEGGHRVPFVARWPGRIAAGSRSDRTVCLTDFMATFAALTGARLPADSAEDSFDMLPVLLGRSEAAVRGAVVHQSASGRLAIREGPWKLVLPGALLPGNLTKPAGGKKGRPNTSGEPTERQLYNLVQDPGETNDVIAAHSDIEKRLADLFARFQTDGRSRPRE